MQASFVLKRKVPDSVLPYPDGLWNRIKYLFWKAITPGYLFGMHLLLRLHIIHHEGRQNFLLGHLAPGKDINDFVAYLEQRDIKNHFIAWEDDDQVVSLRKLVNFEWQYHLRIFNDGEVRGHYEYTPEAHPIWHSMEKDWEPRRKEFLALVGDWIVPSKE